MEIKTIISQQPVCKTCCKTIIKWNPFADEHEHVECTAERISTSLINIIKEQLKIMNIEDYKKKENEIMKSHKLELHKLRTEYIEKNKKFNIGDYIFNVTGMIKVDRVYYNIFRDSIEIVYFGYRYRKLKGEILRTKDKKYSSMHESNDLKLLKSDGE